MPISSHWHAPALKSSSVHARFNFFSQDRSRSFKAYSRREPMSMQRTRSNGSHGGGQIVQSALQLLLSRVQSSIKNAASVAHLSGRSIRDFEQFALRGSPLTADDLVSLCAVLRLTIHVSSMRHAAGVRRRYRQPSWHNQRQRVSCKFFILCCIH